MSFIPNNRPPREPVRKVKTTEEIDQLLADHPPLCWLCGRRGVQIAHICGNVGRSHERANLTLLCQSCHERNHFTAGDRRLHIGHMLWIKQQNDPDYYDPERIAVLRGRPIIEPIEEPER